MSREKTDLRMTLIKQRVRTLQRQRINRSLIGLATVCILLSVFLVHLLKYLPRDTPLKFVVYPMYFGAMLLENSGSYVLMAVIAFTLGVVVTFICLYLREKWKKFK